MVQAAVASPEVRQRLAGQRRRVCYCCCYVGALCACRRRIDGILGVVRVRGGTRALHCGVNPQFLATPRVAIFLLNLCHHFGYTHNADSVHMFQFAVRMIP